MTEQIKEEKPAARLTYIGRRVMQKGRVMHCLEDSEGTIWTYGKSKAHHWAGAKIGRIYELPDDGRLPTSPGQTWAAYEVSKLDDEACAKLQILDRNALLSKQQKAVDPTPELSKAIEVLKKGYHTTPISQRVRFEVWLLSQIRKY